MTRSRAEKLTTLFLAIFSIGLAAQLALAGALQGTSWIGAITASLGSLSLAVGVRVWPQPATATARRRSES